MARGARWRAPIATRGRPASCACPTRGGSACRKRCSTSGATGSTTTEWNLSMAEPAGMGGRARISAFTFLRNGIRFGYPFVESIRSALPLVDEYVVALGDCDDGTREAIEAIGDPRIRIIPTQWNEAMTDRGFVY